MDEVPGQLSMHMAWTPHNDIYTWRDLYTAMRSNDQDMGLGPVTWSLTGLTP